MLRLIFIIPFTNGLLTQLDLDFTPWRQPGLHFCQQVYIIDNRPNFLVPQRVILRNQTIILLK